MVKEQIFDSNEITIQSIADNIVKDTSEIMKEVHSEEDFNVFSQTKSTFFPINSSR